MIAGMGIDLIEIARIRAVYTRHGERFLKRILTAREQQYILQHSDPATRFAGRWAAKEAASKALGTGISGGIRWHDIEIINDESGRPELIFHALALARAKELKATRYHITISHCDNFAMAQAIIES